MRQITASIVMVTVIANHSAAGTKYAKLGGLTSGNCDSWANACTLDRALFVATEGDAIWAKKTDSGAAYAPLYLKNGVKLIGGFAGTETQLWQSNPTTKVTRIDGGGTQQCVVSEANSSSTVLRGFVISNCRNGDSGDWQGGGGLVARDSDALFVRCIFENNTSIRAGGGVSILGTGSPKFFNCIFRNNGSGTAGSGPDVNVQPMGGGALYIESGAPTFTNCLFHSNRAGGGAALFNVGGAPVLVNCTIADNYGKHGLGGGLHDESGKALLRNCILWGNSGTIGSNQIYNASWVSTNVTFSDVQGSWPGTGNVGADPLFTSASGGDYRLASSASPCDNVGNGVMPDDLGDLDWDTNISEPVSVDLAGNTRVNLIVDMGAYEIQNDIINPAD